MEESRRESLVVDREDDDDGGEGREEAPPLQKRHIRDILGRTNFFSVIHMTLL